MLSFAILQSRSSNCRALAASSVVWIRVSSSESAHAAVLRAAGTTRSGSPNGRAIMLSRNSARCCLNWASCRGAWPRARRVDPELNQDQRPLGRGGTPGGGRCRGKLTCRQETFVLRPELVVAGIAIEPREVGRLGSDEIGLAGGGLVGEQRHPIAQNHQAADGRELSLLQVAAIDSLSRLRRSGVFSLKNCQCRGSRSPKVAVSKQGRGG